MRTEESKEASRYIQRQNSQVKLRHRISRLETLLARCFLVLQEHPRTSELVQDIEYEILKCSRRLENHCWGRRKD